MSKCVGVQRKRITCLLMAPVAVYFPPKESVWPPAGLQKAHGAVCRAVFVVADSTAIAYDCDCLVLCCNFCHFSVLFLHSFTTLRNCSGRLPVYIGIIYYVNTYLYIKCLRQGYATVAGLCDRGSGLVKKKYANQFAGWRYK